MSLDVEIDVGIDVGIDVKIDVGIGLRWFWHIWTLHVPNRTVHQAWRRTLVNRSAAEF